MLQEAFEKDKKRREAVDLKLKCSIAKGDNKKTSSDESSSGSDSEDTEAV